MNDKEFSIFDHCKYCEHTKDECQKCYPELGYKNTKMERDTKATEEFIKNFAKP